MPESTNSESNFLNLKRNRMAPPLNKVALCCVPVEMNTKHFVYGDKMFCRANGGLEGNTIEKNISD